MSGKGGGPHAFCPARPAARKFGAARRRGIAPGGLERPGIRVIYASGKYPGGNRAEISCRGFSLPCWTPPPTQPISFRPWQSILRRRKQYPAVLDFFLRHACTCTIADAINDGNVLPFRIDMPGPLCIDAAGNDHNSARSSTRRTNFSLS